MGTAIKTIPLLLLGFILSFIAYDQSTIQPNRVIASEPVAAALPEADFSWYGNKHVTASILTPEQLAAAFQKISEDPAIPYGVPDEGCAAKAHKMVHDLDDLGVVSAKIFISIPWKEISKNNGQLVLRETSTPQFEVPFKNVPGGFAKWFFHVAPVVFIKDGNRNVAKVLDPVLFDHPADVLEWTNKISKPGQKHFLNYRKRFDYQWPTYDDEASHDYDPVDSKYMEAEFAADFKKLEDRNADQNRANNPQYHPGND